MAEAKSKKDSPNWFWMGVMGIGAFMAVKAFTGNKNAVANPIDCVRKERSVTNDGTLVYVNTCHAILNYQFCKNSGLGNVMEMFGSDSKLSCSSGSVGRGGYLGIAYLAEKENHSLLSAAVATTEVRVFACFDPKKPVLVSKSSAQCR